MFHAPVSSWIDEMPYSEFVEWQVYIGKVGLPSERANIRAANTAMHSVLPYMRKGRQPRLGDFLALRDPWGDTHRRVMTGDEMANVMKQAKAQQNARYAERMRRREGWH